MRKTRKRKRICPREHIRKKTTQKKMLRMIYPYVGIIQIRFWVQTIQSVLSLLTASSPFVRHYSAGERKMQ